MRPGDYEFYISELGGSIGEGDFRRLSHFAEALLRSFTDGRSETPGAEAFSRELTLARCALVEQLFRSGGRKLASAANDGYSESYFDDGRSVRASLYAAAFDCLAGTGLMYAGV